MLSHSLLDCLELGLHGFWTTARLYSRYTWNQISIGQITMTAFYASRGDSNYKMCMALCSHLMIMLDLRRLHLNAYTGKARERARFEAAESVWG